MKITLQDISKTEEIQNTLHLSHLCAKVLSAKQLDYTQISQILSAPILHDPMCAIHMPEVIARIKQAKPIMKKC